MCTHTHTHTSAFADLDLITRQDFLDYLRKESEECGTTIIYATHIFDGLDDWATHLGYIADNTMKTFGHLDDFEDLAVMKRESPVAPLFRTIAFWLRRDRDAKRARGEKTTETAANTTDELRGAVGNGYLPGRFSMGYA